MILILFFPNGQQHEVMCDQGEHQPGKDMEKLNYLYIAVQNIKWSSQVEEKPKLRGFL